MKRIVPVLAFALALAVGGRAQAAPIVGGVTDVTFDAGIAALFSGIDPLGTATLNGLTATFPITGGTTEPFILIEHEGSGLGLSTVGGSNRLDLLNFLIDVDALTVFGDVGLDNSGPLLFDLPLFSIEEGLRLALTTQSAGALAQYLGIGVGADLTGLEIATANPQPKIPEPGVLLLMGMGLVALGRRMHGSRQ
ncbi:MAG: PEP-CTERM sorting domain-containing protein [Vicinamibacterales bacterium]|nr:PEP-CTERM sorting domain-containing protein [Vicinamibacterales bacterium]